MSMDASGGSRIFEMGAGIKRHRCKEGGWDVGRDVPSHWGWDLGRGLCPLSRKYLDFYLEIASFGAFWGVFKVYIPIFACHFCDRKGDWYDGAWI